MNKNKSFIFQGLAAIMILAIILGVPGSSVRVSAQETPLLIQHDISGFLSGQAIQIDDLDNNPDTTPNANMTTEGTKFACPAPNTEVAGPNVDCPTVPSVTYVDWNDLAVLGGGPPEGKYAMIDGTGNHDDSFGGTGTTSCLQPNKAAPQKEDIYRAYLANNNQYLYFGLVDKSSNGDSRHVIMFHKKPIVTGDPCAGDGTLLYLDLELGDRMILAIFKPSATEPAARVFSVKYNPDLMLIDDAANFSNTDLWDETATAVNFAVNTTAIPQDKLGYGEPNSNPVLAETFGEGAVSLSSLGITGCGGKYQVTVITRSSGSGGGEAKDFIGGAYDFGSITVSGQLTPSCNADFGYSAQAKDAAGVDIEDDDVTYAWSCDSTLSWFGKSGTQGADAGSYSCDLNATQISSSCTVTQTGLTVDVYDPVGASAALSSSCNLTVPYSGSGSDGSGLYSYAWAFSGACTGSSTSASGNVTLASPGGSCTGTLTVTDLRTDLPAGSCTDTASDSAAGYVPLDVVPSLTPTCNMGVLPEVNDASFSSSVSGGSPAGVDYAWAFGSTTAGCTVTPDTSTDASGGLNVAPPLSRGPCNVNGSVTVTDKRTDATCTDSGGPVNTTVYAPIEVTITPDAENLTCDIPTKAGFDNGDIGAVTFSAVASGGDGAYTYAWSRTGPNEAAVCATTSNTCAVDIPDNNYCALTTIKVGVDDGTTLCSSQDSETESVTKQTDIWSTNN